MKDSPSSENEKWRISMTPELVHGRYSLSDLEYKILLTVLAQVDSKKGLDDQRSVVLSPAELSSMGIGFSKSTIYRDFAEACKNVVSTLVSIKTIDPKKDVMIEEDIPLFSRNQRITSLSSNILKEVSFSISSEAAPYLTKLTKDMKFVQFLYHVACKMKKSSSIKLYKWCRLVHWINISRKQTRKSLSLYELRLQMGVPMDKYPTYNDFNRYILTPSVNEINKHSDVIIESVQGIRTGRKVTDVEFVISNNPDYENSLEILDKADNYPEILNPPGKNVLEPKLAKHLKAEIRLSDKDIQAVALYGDDVVKETFLDYMSQSLDINISNSKRYFLGILKKKVKENSAADHNISHKSTRDKILDTTWAENDWIESLDNEQTD